MDSTHEPAPPIAPLEPAADRPLFSVMVPTYEPEQKLVRTLRSVLRQAPAAGTMQIAVVDDASRAGLVRHLVRSVDPAGRIEVHEHADRLGLCGNWNRAIELARGQLVHLLHQDDYVLPGFYQRIEQGFRRAPQIGMAFCRSRIVDGDGRLIRRNSAIRWTSGVIADWLPVIAERQRVQTPSAVVARGTYETIGGFRPDLCLALDWEMWVRIAARYPVWYEARALAVYRRHSTNETTRLVANGDAWPDLARAIRINARSLPAELRERVTIASARWCAASALRTAERQLAAGASDEATATLARIDGLLGLLDGRPLAVERRLRSLWSRVGNRRAA